MAMRYKLLIPICLFFLAACLPEEKPADISTVKTYSRHGIRFSYPDNWTVSIDTKEARVTTIMIDSEYSDLVAEVISPPADLSLEQYVDLYSEDRWKSQEMPLAGLKFTYTERPGRSVKITRKKAGRVHEKIHRRYEGTVAGMKILFYEEFIKFPWEYHTVFIRMRGPEEDRSLVEPGYSLIIETLTLDPPSGKAATAVEPDPTG
jgi:hypothetical protein